jgi:4-amino-4-deoxy-L-arabinose transferase-like glycosyltransferase
MNGYSLIVSAARGPVKRRNLAAGPSNGIADPDHLNAYRPAATSLVWVGVFRALGHRYDVDRLTHCLVAAVSIALVYAIGRRIFSETLGLWSTAIFAFWPRNLMYSI